MTLPSRPAWYRSFYWRIGVMFVAFVLVILVTQSLIFSYIIARGNELDSFASPDVFAMGVAADVAAAVRREPGLEIDAYLKTRYASERALFFVQSDGTTFSNVTGEVPESIRRTAASAFGSRPVASGGPSPPVITTPVLVDQRLIGLVLLPPPPPGGMARELGRLLSLPSTLVLIASTVVVALLIFRPARRRLSALESAAQRLGAGELNARAPQVGGDEIARVAVAFNRMASELETRDAALRTSDALRRQMLADVSHELKTPLTAMRGYIETLRMPEVALDAERRDRYFDTIDRETRRLERIVKDLLDLARYEHGGVVLQPRVFDIEQLFTNVAGRHERDAQLKHVAIRVQVEALADQVVADPDRIEQAIENLVANAIRHTPAGGSVTLRATQANGVAALSVGDTGGGIAPEHLPHVFERFYKVDPARAAEATGSGLGLSITKVIVERHGGTIGVTSEPGRTVFTILLPQSPSAYVNPL